jgi:hypothetical protein
MNVGVVLLTVLYRLNIVGFNTDDNFNSGDDFGNDDWYDFVSLNIGHKYLSSSYGNEFFLLLKLAFKV